MAPMEKKVIFALNIILFNTQSLYSGKGPVWYFLENVNGSQKVRAGKPLSSR